MVLLNKQDKAIAMAQDVANLLSSDEWLSTQTTAYMLLAISRYAGANSKAGNLKATLKMDGKNMPVNTPKMMSQTALNFATGNRKTISVSNTGSQPVYVRVITQGVPLMQGQEKTAENLSMSITYIDKKGNKINPALVKQGVQFYANVTLKHPGIRMDYKDLALSMLIPSGWEIINARMELVNAQNPKTDVPDYQDIRDDRVYMYFNLPKGRTKTFSVLLQPAYPGKFYLPSVQVEAMYDGSVRAYSGGYWVQVN